MYVLEKKGAFRKAGRTFNSHRSQVLPNQGMGILPGKDLKARDSATIAETNKLKICSPNLETVLLFSLFYWGFGEEEDADQFADFAITFYTRVSQG